MHLSGFGALSVQGIQIVTVTIVNKFSFCIILTFLNISFGSTLNLRTSIKSGNIEEKNEENHIKLNAFVWLKCTQFTIQLFYCIHSNLSPRKFIFIFKFSSVISVSQRIKRVCIRIV